MRFCKPVPACGLQFWSFQVTSDSSWCFVFVVQQYVIFLLSVERLFLNRLDPRHYGIGVGPGGGAPGVCAPPQVS